LRYYRYRDASEKERLDARDPNLHAKVFKPVMLDCHPGGNERRRSGMPRIRMRARRRRMAAKAARSATNEGSQGAGGDSSSRGIPERGDRGAAHEAGHRGEEVVLEVSSNEQ